MRSIASPDLAQAGTLSIIDIATNTVTTTIPAGAFPSSVAVRGSTAYVTARASSTLLIIDLTTNTVTTTVPVGSGPEDIALTVASAYIPAGAADRLEVVDLCTVV